MSYVVIGSFSTELTKSVTMPIRSSSGQVSRCWPLWTGTPDSDLTIVMPVDMFAIFSLRRPDILPVGEYHGKLVVICWDRLTCYIRPVGDLGVQRGVVRWFLSLHAPTTHPLIISPAKLPKNPEEEAGNKSKSDDVLPTIAEDRAAGSQNQPRALTPDLSSVPPAPSALAETPFQKTSNSDEGNEMVLPTPFTPSINTTLNMIATSSNFTPPPLPEGMTPGVLKNRLQGKKAK